jgi:hypothetical protein
MAINIQRQMAGQEVFGRMEWWSIGILEKWSNVVFEGN